MSPFRHMPSFWMIAAIAVAGMVLPASTSSACSSTTAADPTPSCCAKKRSSVVWLLRSCSSLEHSENLAPKTPVQAESPSALSLPEASDCECRPDRLSARKFQARISPDHGTPVQVVPRSGRSRFAEISRSLLSRMALAFRFRPDYTSTFSLAPLDLVGPSAGAIQPRHRPGFAATGFVHAWSIHERPLPFPRHHSILGGRIAPRDCPLDAQNGSEKPCPRRTRVIRTFSKT